MYSPLVLDHFSHPRGCGSISDADAVARVENPVCGDTLELSLRVTGQIIAEARFLAKGCVPAIACGSRLMEMIQGLSLEEARNIDREAVMQSLGGLPTESHHAAQLCIDALRAALKNYLVGKC